MADPSLPIAESADDDTSHSSPLVPEAKRTHPTRLSALSQAARQAWQDLKTVRLRTATLEFFLYLAWAGVLLGFLIFLAIFGSGNLVEAVCKPDGTFSSSPYNFKYWTTGFFEISLAFGAFSFAEVKALDVAFQLVVARGGQALLAFLSWKAFSAHVTVKMTEAPVTYATFWAIFLHQEPTLLSAYRLAREFYRHRRPGSVAAAAGIVLAILFLLVFPTAVNSMTGYMAVSVPYVESRDGNMIGASAIDQVAYIIHDGHRIGKTDDYIVPFKIKDPLTLDSILSGTECTSSNEEPECDLLRAVSDYTESYGFYAQADQNKTTWNGNVTLPGPPLNISGGFFPGSIHSSFYGRDWQDPRTGEKPFRDEDRVRYVYVSRSEVYDREYISEHGKCQPSSSELYQWGFAFVQLFLMVTALFAWSIYIRIVWHKANRRLQAIDKPAVPSGWRAVLELSRSMEAELSNEGIDVMSMTDSKAKREIRERLNGGAVSFKQYHLSRKDRALLSASLAWLRKEKWWVGSFVLCVAMIPAILCPVLATGTSVWPAVVAAIFLGWMALSVGLVAWIGTTRGSRLVMLLGMGLVGVPVAFSYYLSLP